MGHHVLRLLKFAIRYPNQWHTYGTDSATVRALHTLERHGLLEVSSATRQFRLVTGSAE